MLCDTNIEMIRKILRVALYKIHPLLYLIYCCIWVMHGCKSASYFNKLFYDLKKNYTFKYVAKLNLSLREVWIKCYFLHSFQSGLLSLMQVFLVNKVLSFNTHRGCVLCLQPQRFIEEEPTKSSSDLWMFSGLVFPVSLSL